jgi:hypothetical protein
LRSFGERALADYAAGQAAAVDLVRCLAFNLSAEDTAALRLRLFSGAWEPTVDIASKLRLLPALAAAVSAKRLTAGLPALRDISGEATPTAALADALTTHDERRSTLRQRAAEVIDYLAAADIYPVLLKGARAIWTGTPAWRSLRDIDLLVPAPQTSAAVGIAIANGYRPNDLFDAPKNWHHGAELYRDDLPGWLEIHERGGVQRMEVILSTEQLVAAAVPIATTPGGNEVLVLPAPLHILHCLMHHHVGHRGDYDGVIDFKGLYEFAADIDVLDEAAREALLDAASQHPRLMAMLDLWLAAAADVFRLDIRRPLTLADDALRYWTAARARAVHGTTPSRFTGLPCELSMAVAATRLRRQPHGATRVGRLRLRYTAIRSIATRAAGG